MLQKEKEDNQREVAQLTVRNKEQDEKYQKLHDRYSKYRNLYNTSIENNKHLQEALSAAESRAADLQGNLHEERKGSLYYQAQVAKLKSQLGEVEQSLRSAKLDFTGVNNYQPEPASSPKESQSKFQDVSVTTYANQSKVTLPNIENKEQDTEEQPRQKLPFAGQSIYGRTFTLTPYQEGT